MLVATFVVEISPFLHSLSTLRYGNIYTELYFKNTLFGWKLLSERKKKSKKRSMA